MAKTHKKNVVKVSGTSKGSFRNLPPVLRFLLVLLALLVLITVSTLAYSKYKENQLQAKAGSGGYRVYALTSAGKISMCKRNTGSYFAVGVIGESYTRVKPVLTVTAHVNYSDPALWTDNNGYFWGQYVYTEIPAGLNAYVDARLGPTEIEGKVKVYNIPPCPN